MDKLTNIIEKLANIAQKEVVPQFYIADDVMTRIALMQRSRQTLLPLELFAGFAAVAASIMLFISLQTVQNLLNPMSQLLVPYQGASLW